MKTMLKLRMSPWLTLLLKVDAETEAAELVEKHVERFGDSCRWHSLAFDNRLVGLGAACDVVGLDSDDLLENVGGTECFERPDFHLTETLATELGFTAERLLGDE